MLYLSISYMLELCKSDVIIMCERFAVKDGLIDILGNKH